ncbi:bifunctional uridylate/adenylate kinase [Maublancomyces gigas]|uniref:Bifunctional uridylate/adenylate kinase n=1 Tax=Discina gigas TaxID=1032678 RepID=A0ABR3G8U4_9PEZI
MSENQAEQPQLPLFDSEKVLVIYVLGGPGVGKGTHCKRLAADFNFAYFSVGDLLRAEQNRPGTTQREVIDRCMLEGKIVPAEIAVTLMKRRMIKEASKGKKMFLIDGFPRNMEQVHLFEKEVYKNGRMLFFECSPDVMLKRVLNRGKTSQRIDDNEEAFWKRWNGYLDSTVAVLNFFQERKQVVTINCEGPLDAGYPQVKHAAEVSIRL